MEKYEEVLKILHDKFDWNLTDSLTTTGKKLVADTIKALEELEASEDDRMIEYFLREDI